MLAAEESPAPRSLWCGGEVPGTAAYPSKGHIYVIDVKLLYSIAFSSLEAIYLRLSGPFWSNWVIEWVNCHLKTWYTLVTFSLRSLDEKKKRFGYYYLGIIKYPPFLP